MARILVVEDDEILREGILFALAREGHQVRGAGSLAGMKEKPYSISRKDLLIWWCWM